MSLPVFCDRGGQRLQPSLLSRCAPPKGFRITTHFVSDDDRALKAHPSDRDGDDSTIGASNGDGAAGEIHLRQKPAAKNVAMRIGALSSKEDFLQNLIVQRRH